MQAYLYLLTQAVDQFTHCFNIRFSLCQRHLTFFFYWPRQRAPKARVARANCEAVRSEVKIATTAGDGAKH